MFEDAYEEASLAGPGCISTSPIIHGGTYASACRRNRDFVESVEIDVLEN